MTHRRITAYRPVAYFEEKGKAELADRMEGPAKPSFQCADLLLQALLQRPGFTGGHIEFHFPGVGWFVADDEADAENQADSIKIARRRQEDDNG